MEKLISANKFSRDIVDLAESAHFEYRDLHFSTLDVLSNIDAQPAVEAVPIDYIYRALKMASASEQEALIKLINEFRKSQKIREENDIS